MYMLAEGYVLTVFSAVLVVPALRRNNTTLGFLAAIILVAGLFFTINNQPTPFHLLGAMATWVTLTIALAFFPKLDSWIVARIDALQTGEKTKYNSKLKGSTLTNS